MCDFSLMHVKSRAADVADKLVVKNFGMCTTGFAPADENAPTARESTAVCLLPGTEIAFDAPIETVVSYNNPATVYNTAVGRFVQINKEQTHAHHDALELPEGQIVMLNHLKEGQLAKVLQLPAAPKTAEEAKEQTRLEVVA
jgi:hypothetical protein